MWMSQSAIERIRELEALLRDSVPGEVYKASLARIAELERRVDWQSDVILLKAGRQPLPPEKSQGAPEAQAEVPAITETQLAQAEAVVEEARRLDMGRQETEQALRTSIPGITEEAIAAAISGRVM
jgi:hypothetical protein